MIDAALKMEGDKTGSVVIGVGAAIGGIGVEKYKIEQQIEVFYNPQDPSISVLEPGGTIKGIFLSGAIHFFAISVLAVLVSALVWDYRKTKKMMIMIKAETQMI